MPVRSSSSCVRTWPDRSVVDAAARKWAEDVALTHPEIDRLGYFGSYASGSWGVGSDLDLVAILTDSDQPFHRRGFDWKLTSLPVPAEILIYTRREWETLQGEATRFAQMLARQTVWLIPTEGNPANHPPLTAARR